MTKRRIIFLAAGFVGLCLLAVGAAVALVWFMHSDKLRTLVESQASKATGTTVRIESLRFSWPPAFDAEGIMVAMPGHEEVPLLKCVRVQAAATLRSLLRSHVDSIVVVGAQIHLTEDEQGRLRIPEVSSKGESKSGAGVSIGSLKVIDGKVNVDTNAARAEVSGILITFSEPDPPARDETAFRLNIDSITAALRPNDTEPIPITVKLFQSTCTLRSGPSVTQIDGSMNMRATARAPYLLLPDDLPIGASFAADYIKERDSLENGTLSLSVPLFSVAKIYGAVTEVSGKTPQADLDMVIEAPEMAKLAEYCELFQRPTYKDRNVTGKLKVSGKMTGAIESPKIVVRAGIVDGGVEWSDIAVEEPTLEMPVSFQANSVSVGPGRFAVNKALLSVGERPIEVSPLSAVFSADASGVTINEITAKLEHSTQISMKGAYEFASGHFLGTANVRHAEVPTALALISSTLYEVPDSLTATGVLDLDGNVEGIYKSTIENINATCNVYLADGGLTSADFVTATGISARLDGKVQTRVSDNSWTFKVTGDAGGFDVRGSTFHKNFSKTRFPIAFSGEYLADAERFQDIQASTDLGPMGKVTAQGSYEFGSGHFTGKVGVHHVEIPTALALISSTLYKVPDSLTATGVVDIDGDVEGAIGSTIQNMKAKYAISLSDGEISSGEFVTAAGIKAALNGNIETSAPEKSWRFDASGDAGSFELLVDTFYKDFSESRFPLSFAGEYMVDKSSLENGSVTVDLGRMGLVSAQVTAELEPSFRFDTRVKADKIDLQEVYKEVGKDFLSEWSSVFADAEVGGIVTGNVDVHYKGNGVESTGRLMLSDGRLNLAQGECTLESLSMDLPFALYLPQEEGEGPVQFEPEDYGKITLAGLDVGPVKIPSLTLEVALKDNALDIKKPSSISLFDGTLDVGEVRGKNLLGASARVTTSVSAEGISVGNATEKLGLPRVDGTFNAELPTVVVTADAISVKGSAKVNVFGGHVEITSAGIDGPFSPVRTYKADMAFKDIGLAGVTSVLGFGSITGVMDGTLEGFEISHGQPAAFVADFETVKRRGVPQKINIDAVHKITILGTGRGLQAGVGRGLAVFFDEFGYDTIGFYCSLKNDNFRMKGKVVRGNTEYFVKGVTFGPSINVINRNPNQTVSFKAMLERINRIKKE